MSNSDSTLSTTRWCMSTGTRPSSFASMEAGSGGGVTTGVGDGVLDGPTAVGLLLPPHAAATKPTAPAANSERRETAREKGGCSGDTSESVPFWAAGQPTTLRARTSKFDKLI